jgi:hypothetical protein
VQLEILLGKGERREIPDTLNAGESLGVNQSIQFENRQFSLSLQPDGNMVLYQGAPSIDSAIWSTQTAGLEALRRPTRATLQDDGNFVLYSDFDDPAWDSGTSDIGGGARLVLQNDGNLVIYGQPDGFGAYYGAADGAAANPVVWASNTAVLAAPQEASPVYVDTGEQNVAWGKWMRTWGYLYRSGKLQLNTFTRNDNWWAGLRGRVLVEYVDAAGRAIWVSQIFECPTRCSVPDFSCASYGTTWLTEDVPQEVGQLTIRLDVYQADTDVFIDMRQRICVSVKALQPVLVATGQAELAALAGVIERVLQC